MLEMVAMLQEEENSLFPCAEPSWVHLLDALGDFRTLELESVD